MKNKKEIGILVLILLTTGFLRFYNLMHDYPYFFNPDERNMANAVSQFRLPGDLSQIPICLISQIRPIISNDPGSSSRSNDPGSSAANCNLNPHFFAYGQFPLYLAFASDIFTRGGLAVLQGLPLNNYLSTSFSSSIFWLRFWSALSSVLTVLFVYLITNVIANEVRDLGAKRRSNIYASLDSSPRKAGLGMTPGTIAAILAAFSPGLIQGAHFGTTESFLAFFFLASVYLSLRYLSDLRNLKFVFLISLTIGLALGSKLTGIFFFVPPLIALMVRVSNSPQPPLKVRGGSRGSYWKLAYIGKLGFIGLPARIATQSVAGGLVIIGSIAVFVLSSPYNLIEPENFKSAVFGYEQDVATGRYEAFYTRQFVNTIPFLFQAEKVFPYALGWPVFVLGSMGFLLITFNIIINGFLFILSKIKNLKLKIKNYKAKFKILNFELSFCILHFSFLIYILPNAFLFAKWTRFMTPILPFFSIFAGYFLGNAPLPPLKVRGGIRGSYLIGLLVFIFLLPGIAFMSIYAHEDTRVQASRWIYNNIPNNSYVLSETANVVDIPVGLKDTSDGDPKGLLRGGEINKQPPNKTFQVISFDFYHLDENPLLFSQLTDHLSRADYIFIPSRRIFADYPKLPEKYPLVTKYYQLLFSGALGFEKVAEFSTLPDEDAEETFTVFDHPVIRIYRKIKPMTLDEYRSLLTTARID